MITGRLILGDQLHPGHSWYQRVDPSVRYFLIEAHDEQTYAPQHRQKMLGFLAAMRRFAAWLESKGHAVTYVPIGAGVRDLASYVAKAQKDGRVHQWEMQEPDEYRLDAALRPLMAQVVSSEHFMTERHHVAAFFAGKKTYLMESFYRDQRKKTGILMDGEQPHGGSWNYDAENRKPWPAKQPIPSAWTFSHDLRALDAELDEVGLPKWGRSAAEAFPWPLDRTEALEVWNFFIEHLLPSFGPYQDALVDDAPFLYHARISFALNTKMLTPLELLESVEAAYRAGRVSLSSAEGFIRQVMGWREYVRGIYWAQMPEYATLNALAHRQAMPDWFYTGKTKMRCVSQAIHQSLQHSYAHHIQRLMVTGNIALLLGLDPDSVDAWYLGIYLDAIEWVEMPNTRGMSQFADGGILGSKPYVSSGAYIHKMSNHCRGCAYSVQDKDGPNSCPFNALYWEFHHRHRERLAQNPRIGMVYRTWDRFTPERQHALLERAAWLHEHVEEL